MTAPQTEIDWDAVFADEAVTRLTHCTLPNKSTYHTKDDDERILATMRENAPVIKKIIAEVNAAFAGAE